MEYIFVGHASSDDEILAKLISQLKFAGYKTWQDEEAGAPGDDLGQQTIFAIERSDAYLLALSIQSNDSEKVFRQLELAQQSQRPIFVAILEQVEPSPEVSQFIDGRPNFDLSQEFEKGFNRLLDSLKERDLETSLTGADVGMLGGDPYPEIPMLVGEEVLWSQQGYYWYKKWRNLVRVEAVLTNDRLIFIWDTRDAWKWKAREWDDLKEGFPILVQLSDIIEISPVHRPKSLLIFATSEPFAEIKTSKNKVHKITFRQQFEEKMDSLRELIS